MLQAETIKLEAEQRKLRQAGLVSMELISKTEMHADRDEKVSAGKLHATQYIVVLVLAVLAAGMWRLQVLGVDNYRMLAEANRVRKEPVRAPRGKIFDREGRIADWTCRWMRSKPRCAATPARRSTCRSR
jgi:hypothetical protein